MRWQIMAVRWQIMTEARTCARKGLRPKMTWRVEEAVEQGVWDLVAERVDEPLGNRLQWAVHDGAWGR